MLDEEVLYPDLSHSLNGDQAAQSGWRTIGPDERQQRGHVNAGLPGPRPTPGLTLRQLELARSTTNRSTHAGIVCARMRKATGLATVAAFDSGNFELVARTFREHDPAWSIIIAGDNDHHLPRRESPLPNVGLEKAAAAAQAVAGIVLTPTFAPTDKGTDWNDYAAQHGTAAVRMIAEVELRPYGIALAPGPVSRPVTQADRDAMRQKMTAFPKRGPSAASKAIAETARRAQQVSRTLRPKL